MDSKPGSAFYVNITNSSWKVSLKTKYSSTVFECCNCIYGGRGAYSAVRTIVQVGKMRKLNGCGNYNFGMLSNAAII